MIWLRFENINIMFQALFLRNAIVSDGSQWYFIDKL